MTRPLDNEPIVRGADSWNRSERCNDRRRRNYERPGSRGLASSTRPFGLGGGVWWTAAVVSATSLGRGPPAPGAVAEAVNQGDTGLLRGQAENGKSWLGSFGHSVRFTPPRVV